MLAELKTLDLATGKEIQSFSKKNIRGVTAIAITPDGNRILCGLKRIFGSYLQVFNLNTGTEEFTLSGHTDWINAIAITHNGQKAISASEIKH